MYSFVELRVQSEYSMLFCFDSRRVNAMTAGKIDGIDRAAIVRVNCLINLGTRQLQLSVSQ